MSLPVGTLVMLVRARHQRNAHMNGSIGEVVGPLEWRVVDWTGRREMAYKVRLHGHRSGGPNGNWACAPNQIIPITPPGRTDDVTTNEPIREGETE